VLNYNKREADTQAAVVVVCKCDANVMLGLGWRTSKRTSL
jgi:hypothetical protein